MEYVYLQLGRCKWRKYTFKRSIIIGNSIIEYSEGEEEAK